MFRPDIKLEAVRMEIEATVQQLIQLLQESERQLVEVLGQALIATNAIIITDTYGRSVVAQNCQIWPTTHTMFYY